MPQNVLEGKVNPQAVALGFEGQYQVWVYLVPGDLVQGTPVGTYCCCKEGLVVLMFATSSCSHTSVLAVQSASATRHKASLNPLDASFRQATWLLSKSTL